jgi:branched-chain amino acid transport system substrate-binding protein
MRASRLVAALVVAACAMPAAGCVGNDRPFRLGVLTDCQGPFHAFEEAELSGVELPLIERGARLRGPAPTDGVTDATAGGRKVELVRGCAETGEFAVFLEEARRLVETEHVDAIVGGNGPSIRDVARLYPTVPFVATFWDEQEVTLRKPVANVYRFETDYGQHMAGLGAYAYRDLGWRRASILAGDASPGWGAAAAFIAEFCSLGGRITDEVYLSPWVPMNDPAAQALRSRPDGVALLLTSFDSPLEVTRGVLQRLEQPDRQLLLNGPLIEDPTVLQSVSRRLDRVVSTSLMPVTTPSRELTGYRQRYAKTFKGLPASLGDQSFVIGYGDAVRALLAAVDETGGDLSGGRVRLREALAKLRIDLPRGDVRLDSHRQAVADVPLVRMRWQDGHLVPRPLSVAHDVEQTFAGLLSAAPPPGPGSQPCVKAKPPPWAR